MTLTIARGVLEAIGAHVEQAEADEACGLLFGQGERITQARAAINVATDKARRFEIDPQALVDAHRAARAGGPPMIGYYHSHPTGSARPSAIDRAMAPGDGKVWAIVGEDGVTFWRDDEGGFAPLPYVVEDR